MEIEKYFWDLNTKALAETKIILKDPRHPKFAMRMSQLLSRCDNTKEVFFILTKEEFIKSWPSIRSYWQKRERQSDFRDWWETIFEQLLEDLQAEEKSAKGGPAPFLRKIGMMLKEARLNHSLSQEQLAKSVGMKQPDISKIEEGRSNITLFTLKRLCKILGIKEIVME